MGVNEIEQSRNFVQGLQLSGLVDERSKELDHHLILVENAKVEGVEISHRLQLDELRVLLNYTDDL